MTNRNRFAIELRGGLRPPRPTASRLRSRPPCGDCVPPKPPNGGSAPPLRSAFSMEKFDRFQKWNSRKYQKIVIRRSKIIID